jgi:hypothetical protein
MGNCIYFVDFLLVTENEMEEHYNISDEVFRKCDEATGSPIPTKSSERYNKDYKQFCECSKENAVNEVNEEVMLAYLFMILILITDQSRYSLRKCPVLRSGLNSQWLKQCWWSLVHEHVDISRC